MANRQHWNVQATANDTKLVYGTFVGNGATAPTVVGGEVLSVTRSGAGVLVINLRNPYVSTLVPEVVPVGPTKLRAVVTAINMLTPSITVELQVGAGTATDATSSDTVYVAVHAKNSSI